MGRRPRDHHGPGRDNQSNKEKPHPAILYEIHPKMVFVGHTETLDEPGSSSLCGQFRTKKFDRTLAATEFVDPMCEFRRQKSYNGKT